MPRLTQDYDPLIGPLISATVSDPFRERPEEESPRSEKVMLLLDSGASDSSIRSAVAERLSLTILGFHEVFGFGSGGSALQYLADIELWLDVGYEISNWKPLRFNSDYDKFDGILGRDVLSRGRFVLDGPNNKFTLEF